LSYDTGMSHAANETKQNR